MSQILKYGVIGDPVNHSVSPQIHSQFARQFDHLLDYQKYHVTAENLESFIANFFESGGKGLNVTLPHKQTIIKHLDKLTERAKLAQSVNTVFVDQLGLVVGDTTDGEGLILDLKKQQLDLAKSQILVIGVGGAAQSIIPALLNAGASIEILNRTERKAIDIVERFSNLGSIKLIDKHCRSGLVFDCVISSISEFNFELVSVISKRLKQDTFCYDLNYGARAKMFKRFSIESGATRFSDGSGMLIGQAALSYQVWNNVLPDISNIKA
jgi:shikimate dehydrogenase